MIVISMVALARRAAGEFHHTRAPCPVPAAAQRRRATSLLGSRLLGPAIVPEMEAQKGLTAPWPKFKGSEPNHANRGCERDSDLLPGCGRGFSDYSEPRIRRELGELAGTDSLFLAPISADCLQRSRLSAIHRARRSGGLFRRAIG